MFLQIFAFVVVFGVFTHGAPSTKPHDVLENYCWSTDPVRSQRHHFSTRTAYQNVRGDLKQWASVAEDCTPQKVWMLNRHGTRNPDPDDIEKMSELPDQLKDVLKNFDGGVSPSAGGLCEEDLELLRTWKWNSNLTIAYDEFLTPQGWDDLKLLAQAYQAAYPQLFPDTYSEGQYAFRHTDRQRTEASYKGFVEGLFGPEAYLSIPPPPVIVPDFLLRPQDTCSSWLAHDAVHDAKGTEPDDFRSTNAYEEMLDQVSGRLGFSKRLGGGKVRTMFKGCRYNNAWELDKLSPWCAAFTPDNIQVLSYADDLKHFYKAGPGAEINTHVTCSLAADFINHLDNPNDSRTIVHFTHSSSIQLFFNLLGLGHGDGVLLASTFEQFRDNRQFRSSSVPFATNLAIIKYDCPARVQREQALFLHNERPIALDWCVDGLCSWAEVKERYSYYTENECSDIYCPLG